MLARMLWMLVELLQAIVGWLLRLIGALYR